MANEVDAASLREYEKVVSTTFSSQEEAYEFYNDYAKKKGFGIRKSIIKKDPKNGTITFRRFYCSKSGFREKKYLDKPDRKRAAPALSRCGCPVKLCIKLDPKIDRWWVTNYVDIHNHSLAVINERWTKTAKSLFSSDKKSGDFEVSEQVQMYHELTKLSKQICYQASKSSAEYVKTKELLKEERRRLNDIEKGIKKSKVKKDVVSSDKKSPQKIGNPKPVVTKGAQKKKKYERMESSIEGRRKNKCGHCGTLGHNRQTCQLLSSENDAAISYIEKLSELS